MEIDFSYEAEKKLPVDIEALAGQVADAVLDMEECPYEALVSLTIVDDEEIHRINREFRQIDRATDVLSFPAIPFEAPASYDILEEDDSFFDMDTGLLLLGDIVISADRAEEQAKEYGHSIRREVAFLVAHSMLHLLGYDHETPEEESVMVSKQEKVLDSLGITRDSDYTTKGR